MDTPDSQSLFFSVKAADRVAALIAEEKNPKLNLRVVISGGGCSGFLYNFTLDEEINPDDIIVTQQCSDGSSVQLLVDSISYQYLSEAEIDFSEGIEGSLIIRNPNAKSTCGCGSSFSIEEDDD